MPDPLEIRVIANVGDLAKLSAGAKQVSTDIAGMSEQFTKGNASGDQLNATISATAEEVVASDPKIQALGASHLELTEKLAGTQAALRKTIQTIQESGGVAQTGGSLIRKYSEEIAELIIRKNLAAAAERQHKAAIEEGLAGLAAQTELEQKGAVAAAERAVATKTAATETAASAEMDTAANEGMVASDIAVTTAEKEASEAHFASAQALNRLQLAYDQARAAVAETEAIIKQAGGTENAEAGVLERYQAQTNTVAESQQALALATKEYDSTLRNLLEVQTQSTGAAQVGATANTAAANVVVSNSAKMSVGAKQASTDLRAMGEQFLKGNTDAAQLSAAISETASQVANSSPKVQALNKNFLELSAQLTKTKEAYDASTAAIEKAGGAANVEAKALNENASLKGQVAAQTKAVAAVEQELSAAMNEGVAALQARAAAEQKAAMAQAERNAKTQAASAQTAASAEAETSANANVVSSDVAVANAENEVSAATMRRREEQQATAASATNAAATNAAATNVALSSAAKLAQNLMQTGISAKDAESALVNMGYSAKEAAAAMAELGNAENEASAATMRQREEQVATTATTKAGATASTAASQVILSNGAKNAQTFMRQGLSAKDAESALVAMGYSAKEAAAALAELGIVAETVAGEEEVLNTKLDQGTKSLAFAGVRLLANEGAMGKFGFAIARLASTSQTLAPILAAAFPIIGAIALLEMLGQLNTKMTEWSQQAEKAADEAATFDRALQKMGEAADQAREKLASTVSPMAGVAERMADAGKKSVNLTSDMQTLNKHIESLPGSWTGISTTIGKTWVGLTDIFRDQSTVTAREVELFTRGLADETKTAADVPAAIEKITAKLAELQAELKGYEGGDVWRSIFTGPKESEVNNINSQIDALARMRNALGEVATANKLTTQSEQISQQQALNTQLTKLAEERLGFEEDEAKRLVRSRIGTLEQQRDETIRIEKEISDKEIAEVSFREGTLRRIEQTERASGVTTDHSAAFAEMEAKKSEAHERFQRKRADISFNTDEQIESRDLGLATVEIETDAKIAESAAKVGEARNRQAFDQADTIKGVETAAVPLIERTNELYRIQIEEKQKLAGIRIEAKMPADLPKPTAEVGTDEFSLQLEAMKKREPELYAELLKMNQEVISLRRAQAAAIEGIEIEEEQKEKNIRSQQLTDRLSQLNNQLVQERGSYQQGSTALQARLAENRNQWRTYYADVSALAQQNYYAEIGTLSQEETAVRAALAARVISEQEAAIKIDHIHKQEEQAFNQMQNRELEAAKKAIQKEEQEVHNAAQKMGQAFASATIRIITANQSVGRSFVQLGAQMELYIIEQGIKKVVSHYAASLLQMVAEHSDFIARILGIETAGSAAKEAVAKASAVGDVSADAAVAAAAAFASVMEALPFPTNVATAGPAASAAAAQTMAFLSLATFHEGGIVSSLQEGEMVLPKHISSFIQGAVGMKGDTGAAGASGGAPTINHHHYNVRVDGAKGDLGESVYQQILPAIRRANRRGSLPSTAKRGSL